MLRRFIRRKLYAQVSFCAQMFYLLINSQLRKFYLDIDVGGILNLISENVKRNTPLIRNNIEIVELDFKAQTFSETVESIISDVEIVICADGKNNNKFFKQ